METLARGVTKADQCSVLVMITYMRLMSFKECDQPGKLYWSEQATID